MYQAIRITIFLITKRRTPPATASETPQTIVALLIRKARSRPQVYTVRRCESSSMCRGLPPITRQNAKTQQTKGAGTLRRAVRSRAFAGIPGGRHMECAYTFDFCRLCMRTASGPYSCYGIGNANSRNCFQEMTWIPCSSMNFFIFGSVKIWRS